MTSSDKHSFDDGRHYKNPFYDYSAEKNIGAELIDANKNDITDVFKNRLMGKAKHFTQELEKNKQKWYNREDFSIYTGNAGIAQMYFQLGVILKEPSYKMRACELIEKSLTDGKGDKRISYLAGRAGPLALGAMINHSLGNVEESRKMISKLTSFANRALNENSNELLYGRVGYLYALLFVNANIPSCPIDEKLIKQFVNRILETGREYAKSCDVTSLMYQWHEKEYIGGAHGLAGILYILLQAREYLTESQLNQDIEPSLNYLQKIRFSSGNFPSSLGNNSDKLVHWCHGAPSMTMLFAHAYKVFGRESYFQTAIECGEVVWSRGLLKKGYSLCHGVSGNTYTFICLYQLTGDTKYLYRACKFAEWCMNYGEKCNRNPDRPYSLFEGLAGTIHLLVDLCEPKLAKFPAYTL